MICTLDLHALLLLTTKNIQIRHPYRYPGWSTLILKSKIIPGRFLESINCEVIGLKQSFGAKLSHCLSLTYLKELMAFLSCIVCLG